MFEEKSSHPSVFLFQYSSFDVRFCLPVHHETVAVFKPTVLVVRLPFYCAVRLLDRISVACKMALFV
ncbi:hypothetical protein M514_27038 [Trichuris suis]|uniref:Uncharacterized protein n=1 Tax=Trichuris suis TaxID=68888 RepID=A0A085MU95_9BILA|nr:hypothetical protein M514_27038 [Trichuris suis]